MTLTQNYLIHKANHEKNIIRTLANIYDRITFENSHLLLAVDHFVIIHLVRMEN